MNVIRTTICVVAAILLTVGSAQATVYQYTVNNPGGSDAAGNVSSIVSTYDDVNEVFNWEYTIEDVAGALSDGFWLAVSPGPNPKGSRGELALIYGDVDAGVATVYEYSGNNDGLSYSNPGNYIGTFALTSSDNGTSSRTVSFGFSVAAINALNLSADWLGIQYGPLLGYWFHPTLGTSFTYNNNEITAFSYHAQGWVDTSNQGTTEVPEPATMLLLGAGLLGVARRRRA